MLFMPVQHPVMAEIVPLYIQGWTINYEVFFYIVMGLCLFAPVKAWFEWIDYGCVVYFVVEVILKLRYFGWRGYFSSKWNRFDFAVSFSDSSSRQADKSARPRAESGSTHQTSTLRSSRAKGPPSPPRRVSP